MATVMPKLKISGQANPLPHTPSQRVQGQLYFSFYWNNIYLHYKIVFSALNIEFTTEYTHLCSRVNWLLWHANLKWKRYIFLPQFAECDVSVYGKHFVCRRWHLLQHLTAPCVLHKQILPHEWELSNNSWVRATLHCIRVSYNLPQQT